MNNLKKDLILVIMKMKLWKIKNSRTAPCVYLSELVVETSAVSSRD